MAGRLTIIGGGVMGLMTAYYAAPLADAVTVLERSRVGDPATASFGLTRSMRNDYRDPAYARLAFEARQLWRELERESGERLLIDCGCLNLVKGSVTPDLDRTYAVESYAVLEQLRLRREVFSRAQLAERFPQFDADGGWLDVDAGFADLAAVTRALREGLRARGVTIAENTEPQAFGRADGTWTVATSYTGVGWRGTGYKFAPWVGKVLAQLAVQRGTVYDIGRFTPARFAGGAPVRGVAS